MEKLECKRGTIDKNCAVKVEIMPLTGFEPALTIVKHRLGENTLPYGISPTGISPVSANLLFGASETLALRPGSTMFSGALPF
jgi:hypothetical protein